MPDLKKKFGKRLQKIRKERGMTQEQLAEAVKTTRDTIRNIESGVHGPRFGLLETIASTLKTNIKDMFDFE